MNKLLIQKQVRKWHRRLGFFIGIQFLAWTLGGLYFSWTNIDEIRGDNLKNPPELFEINHHYQSLQTVHTAVESQFQGEEKTKIKYKQVQLVSILGKLTYQVTLNQPSKKVFLIDAESGHIRQPLTQEEAIEVAKFSLKTPSEAEKVEYITETNGHHEYREKPLPAFAVTFGAPNHTTVYLAAELGTVQSFRNNQWRIFDFLWMMHTMDFKERDDINNWLLRAFSALGLLTLSSGFALFFLTTKFNRSEKQTPKING